jgi:raffinose/stachyose/melibiose transport system substrate-binding protein
MNTEISRRNLLSMGGMLGLGVVLASCTGTGPGGAAGGGKAVQYWTAFNDAAAEKYFRDHAIGDYEGPAEVKLTIKANDTIDQLLQTALAAGRGPDIILTPGPTYVAAYGEAGYLLDLTEYAEKYKWNDVLAPWSLEASKIDGKLVTLPTSYESMAFYFNPAVLDDLGLSAPKTRAEFENLCEEAEGQGLVPIGAGNADWKGANEWHLTNVFNHYSGPDAVYSALKGETPWTDEVFVDAVELLSSYFKRGWYGGSVESYFTNQFPKVFEQLAAGEAAGMISGTWEFASLAPYFGEAAGNSATWDWTTLPALRDGVPEVVWDLGVGASFGINAKSTSKDAAADFMNFLTTDVKMNVAAVEAVNDAPPPIRLQNSDFSSDADERVTRLYTELPKAETIGYTTWTFYPQVTETYMIQEFERVITDQTTAKEFCAGMQERFAKELKAGAVPASPSPSGLSS